MTMISEQQWKTVLAGIASGLTQVDACAAAGVGQSTFYDKMNRDPEFSESVKKANVQFKLKHIKNIADASGQDWKASAWLLERKFKKEFGRHLQVGGDPQNPLVTRQEGNPYDKLTDEQLEQLVEMGKIIHGEPATDT